MMNRAEPFGGCGTCELTVAIVLTVLGAWLAIGIVIALVLGRIVRTRDRR
jgi:hypothetical protein